MMKMMMMVALIKDIFRFSCMRYVHAHILCIACGAFSVDTGKRKGRGRTTVTPQPFQESLVMLETGLSSSWPIA
jgi:hypothetical protein